MKAFTVCFFLCLVAAAGMAQTGVKPSESTDLWERARRIYTANMDWTAGRTVATHEQIDGKGGVSGTTILTHSTRIGGDGAPVSLLVSAAENGRDITEAQRKKEEKGGPPPYTPPDRNQRNSHMDSSPFDDRERGNVTNVPTAETRTIDGRRSRGYSFVWSLPDIKSGYRGTAWIDEASGAPLLLEYAMDPRPAFVSSVTVRLSYVFKGPSEWYPAEMRVEKEGGTIFYHMHVRTTRLFTEYFRRR
jgi:hypothetical protein